ncbi:hypothetical protein L873DRAFT_1916091 [Choiromyces venosus 120613-1]|uniref:Uncharacterized protein n=1 Tax=Choiromyces venosus 120613-1 TaxID=1336337 RepID=A0A3N4K343_9PEZI|nr:hypothetical protein L873DRAFT_1916091 [Choiromyces venosus 120613-1]
MTAAMLTDASQTCNNETLKTVLYPLALSPIAKGAFFITTLMTSLDNVIDNLTTYDTITYTDIYNKLLVVYPAASPTSLENSAFVATNKYHYCKGGNKSKEWNGDGKVCGYCGSKDFKGIEHLKSKCQMQKTE